MECPVCENKSISPFATHCSECGTDVVAYPLLEDLEEQCVDTLKDKVALEGDMTELLQLRQRDKKQYDKKMGRMYWILLLFPLLFFWCGKKNIPVPAKEVDNPVLIKEVESLKKENLELKRELELARNTVAPSKEVLHKVVKGESLSFLAEKYLGDKGRWKEIHEYNSWIKDPELLSKGTEIKIKLDGRDN